MVIVLLNSHYYILDLTIMSFFAALWLCLLWLLQYSYFKIRHHVKLCCSLKLCCSSRHLAQWAFVESCRQ